MTVFAPAVLRDIEVQLSEPRFHGIPLGPTLNNVCVIDLYNGRGDWRAIARWKNRARRMKYYLRPAYGRKEAPPLSKHRTLVTWRDTNYRVSEMVLPVVRELGPGRCSVLCESGSMIVGVPAGAEALSWEVMPLDRAAWRADYRLCQPHWHSRLRGLCRKHRLPHGAFEQLAFHLMIASQCVAACLQFLETARPAAVLAEHDRDFSGACLVLSARSLGIPTFTMVHGVLNEQAVGCVPVLADRILCWGESQRRQFIAAGEDPAKIVVAGCPRLTRELSIGSADARAKLGLRSEGPVVLLGTTPAAPRDCLTMAELFCAAAERLPEVTALVRLHPAERLEAYEPVAKCYPAVRFLQNSEATLDEALAAADIVLVSCSGLGSDALVKRRLVIVVEVPGSPPGYGRELIEQAGCPRVTNSEELTATISRVLGDEAARCDCTAAAERYVADYYSAFGREAARKIADFIREGTAESSGARACP